MKRFASALLALLLTLTLVVPNLAGLAWAAQTDEEHATEQKSVDAVPDRPSGASVFFDSEKEAYSFNTATYWDVYQEDLGIDESGNGQETVNKGLVLTSSTDGGVVSKGEVTDQTSTSQWSGTLENTGWGTFTKGGPFANGQKILTFQNVKLKAGANNIKISFPGSGADLRALRIKDGDGNEKARLVPVVGNVKSTMNTDSASSNHTPTDASQNWVEAVGNASFKDRDQCFGWLDQTSVIYHFVSTELAAGEYTVEVEYARGGAINATATATANDGISSGLKGALRIDYETAKAFTYKQYGRDNNGNYNPSSTKFNYSDGSSTVVGWGGSFDKYTVNNAHKPAKYLAVTVKQVDGPNMEEVLRYLTIHLVASDGTTVDTLDGSAYLKKYDGTFADGYTTYVYGAIKSPKQEGDKYYDVQGIKLVFERGKNEKDISGSIELAYVGICINSTYDTKDTNNWIDFSPFIYNAATINSFKDTDKEAVKLPFLRPNKRDDRNTIEATIGGKNAVVSGYNISTAPNYTWHAWTMSTSDANIVDDAYASHNGSGSFNALEIKYQNTDFHTTYAKLTGGVNREKSGQWLAITLKGEDLKAMTGTSYEDMGNIHIVLKNAKNPDFEESIPLSEFKTTCSASATKVDMADLREGYRTVYYDIGKNTSITTVEFDFSQVKKAEAGEDTHRIYIKDIYLFNAKLTIEKDVDKEVATAGDTLTYTLTVKNPSEAAYTTTYTVKDTLPTGLTYQDGTSEVTGPDGTTWEVKPDRNGQTLTWTFDGNEYSLDKGESMTITFQVKIPDDAAHGTIYNNIADVDGVPSNPERTSVWDAKHEAKVFYAQVGMQTTLNLDLGSSNVTTNEWVQDGEYPIEVKRNDPNNVTSGSGSTKIDNIPANAEVRLSGPGGSFIVAEDNAVTIGGQTWSLKHTDNGYSDFTPHGTLNFHENGDNGASLVGPLSGFGDNAYLVLDGVTSTGQQTVTLNMASMWKSSLNFTLVVGHWEENTETKPNTFAGLGSTGNSYEVSTSTPNGNSDAVLSYTAEERLAETATKFTVKVHPGGDTSQEPQPILVTVYNYNVKDYMYVLDYGLPVYLTGDKESDYAQSIQSFSGTKLFSAKDDTVANDVIRFCGVSKSNQINDNKIADQEEYDIANKYVIPDSVDGVPCDNGKVTSTFNDTTAKEQTIKYTPTRFMDSVDTFYYGVQVVKNDTNPKKMDATNATPVMEGEIKVLPANIVYYEDNFASSGTKADGDDGIKYGGGQTTQVGTKPEAERVQSNDIDLRYGYDEAYELDGKYSGGTATEMAAGSFAVFQFKGTGVDIISSTARNTGTVYVYVYDNAKINENGQVVHDDKCDDPVKLVDVQIVNTYYENSDTGLYQIPVVNVRNLESGVTHVVKIFVSELAAEGKEANPIYLDGLRIYNPLGTEPEDYADYIPSEQNTAVHEIRDMILGDYQISYDESGNMSWTGNGDNAIASLVRFGTDATQFLTGTTVTENFTGAYYGGTPSKDTAMTSSMLSYLLQGPNNELYLSSGYGVAFYVTGYEENSNQTLQIAAKMLTGSPSLYYLSSDAQNEWKPLGTRGGGKIETSTEMYYEIPLDDCKDVGGKKLVAIRVGDGIFEEGTPKNVMSLTYVKASSILSFEAVPKADVPDTKADNYLEGDISTLREPGQNNRKIITFATTKDVIDVKVQVGEEYATYTAASYVFDTSGSKTWIVAYDASASETYEIQLIGATGVQTKEIL